MTPSTRNRRSTLGAAALMVSGALLLPSPANTATVEAASTSTSEEPAPTIERLRGYDLAEPVEPVPLTSDMVGKPNIVLITTDDQTSADLRFMPLTRRLLSRQGVTLDGISPQPLCCPARAEILTGQYAHNNGVRANQGTFGGFDELRTDATVATDLHAAGYETIFMGKFLNGYTRRYHAEQMPGWTSWNPTLDGVYDYDDFVVANDGVAFEHLNHYQTDYFTDLAEQKIAEVAPSDRPFFLWQSYVAPHTSSRDEQETRQWSPPQPAERHRDADLASSTPVNDPSYGEADVSDKPAHIRNQPWGPQRHESLVRLGQARTAALQSVDEGVRDMVAALRRSGELANTLIIFTSDNGYLLGEHRYHGKTLPYEPSLSVPLLIRGPGVPAGVRRREIGTTIDLAPTMLAAAGVQSALPMDGRDLLPTVLYGQQSWQNLLVQAGPRSLADEPAGWFYRGIRDQRWTYVHYLPTGEFELYDRRKDPHQLTNLATSARHAGVRAELARRLLLLQDCVGESCWTDFGSPPKPRGALDRDTR